MDGSFLRFYVHENERLHGQLAWEWLLQRANALGIRGGSAFRAVAGFGRDAKLGGLKSSGGRTQAHALEICAQVLGGAYVTHLGRLTVSAHSRDPCASGSELLPRNGK